MSNPLVSVIIPAFAAEATLPEAIRSVLQNGLAEDALEILVESDDGRDYAMVKAMSAAVKVAVTGLAKSGVGPARNRAMERARGDWVTFLDADDRLGPGFLSEALTLARSHGACIARLLVVRGAEILFDLGRHGRQVDFALVERTGASLRPFARREGLGRFRALLSQDIAHGLEVVGTHGGRLPMTEAPYVLSLQPASVTADADFSARVELAYEEHVRAFLAGETPLPAVWAEAAARVFQAKIALNRRFVAEGAGRHFYDFVASLE